MKEQFWAKIASEYNVYRDSVLHSAIDEIYSKCYEIDVMINFYEILVEMAEKLPDSCWQLCSCAPISCRNFTRHG